MIPPWADPPTAPDGPPAPDGTPPPDGAPPQDGNKTPQAAPNAPIPLAPSARFSGARTNLNRFARYGDKNDMRSGIGHYVSKGYGGAGTAARRFGGTARTASALSGALSALTGGGTTGQTADGRTFDAAGLVGRTADEIIDAVVEAVRPIDGTQDAESAREAVRDAMSEVLDELPNTDLLNLDDPARTLMIERYVAHDVYRRIALDLGKEVQAKAPSAATGVERLKEIQDFVREHVSNAFRNLAKNGRTLSGLNVAQVVREAIRDTLTVFEGYAT
jgi:hypothetical protein